MKKYKVIALSVGGASNKIFRSGDVVTDADFAPGHAEKLVKGGYIKPLEDSPAARLAEIASHGIRIPDVKLPPPPPAEPVDLERFTKAELSKMLLERGVIAPERANKARLIEMLHGLDSADTAGHKADNE